MDEIIEHVNMQYMVRLASDPARARAALAAIQEHNLTHGARYGEDPVPTFLKPTFITPGQRALLERAADHLLGALNRFTDHWLATPALQRAWGVSQEELELYRVDPGYPGAIQVARFDGFLRGDRLQFLEFNCDSPGGAGYGDVIDQAFQAHLLAEDLLEDDHRLTTTAHLPVLAETLRSCYRAWRAGGHTDRPEQPRVVVTDWAEVTSRPDIDITVRVLNELGLEATFHDPRKLEQKGGELFADGERVDLVYKRVITRELVQEPAAGGLVEAYKQGGVCMVNAPRSPIVGNKKTMAYLQDPAVLEILTPPQRAAVRRFVPWTAVLREGRAEVKGFNVDLHEFALHNKDRLVLKPAQGYGGKDVYIGFETAQEDWQALVDGHVGRGDWVVQELVDIPKELFPEVGEEEVTMRLLNVNLNPFVFGGRFAGAYTRVSGTNVINVSAGGGIVPTVTVEPVDGNGA